MIEGYFGSKFPDFLAQSKHSVPALIILNSRSEKQRAYQNEKSRQVKKLFHRRITKY
jgi:hypothetical protein